MLRGGVKHPLSASSLAGVAIVVDGTSGTSVDSQPVPGVEKPTCGTRQTQAQRCLPGHLTAACGVSFISVMTCLAAKVQIAVMLDRCKEGLALARHLQPETGS
jgi:hypothetical protein